MGLDRVELTKPGLPANVVLAEGSVVKIPFAHGDAVVAVNILTVEAVLALAARPTVKAGPSSIANLELGDKRTNPLDDSDPLMAESDRCAEGDKDRVTVADTRVSDAEQDVVRA